MPIYEYRCQECGHELEKLQRLSDEPLRECPACEASALKRLVSAAGFRLKGSGWYETDFKKGEGKRNLADSGNEKPAADGGEAKPAAKPESKKADAPAKTEKSTA